MYDFSIDEARQLIDGRTPVELAKFIDDHAASALTDFEVEFVEKILRQKPTCLSEAQFRLLVKIYDERI